MKYRVVTRTWSVKVRLGSSASISAVDLATVPLTTRSRSRGSWLFTPSARVAKLQAVSRVEADDGGQLQDPYFADDGGAVAAGVEPPFECSVRCHHLGCHRLWGVVVNNRGFFSEC